MFKGRNIPDLYYENKHYKIPSLTQKNSKIKRNLQMCLLGLIPLLFVLLAHITWDANEPHRLMKAVHRMASPKMSLTGGVNLTEAQRCLWRPTWTWRRHQRCWWWPTWTWWMRWTGGRTHGETTVHMLEVNSSGRQARSQNFLKIILFKKGLQN